MISRLDHNCLDKCLDETRDQNTRPRPKQWKYCLDTLSRDETVSRDFTSLLRASWISNNDYIWAVLYRLYVERYPTVYRFKNFRTVRFEKSVMITYHVMSFSLAILSRLSWFSLSADWHKLTCRGWRTVTCMSSLYLLGLLEFPFFETTMWTSRLELDPDAHACYIIG